MAGAKSPAPTGSNLSQVDRRIGLCGEYDYGETAASLPQSAKFRLG